MDDYGTIRAALYARLSHENDESVAYQMERLCEEAGKSWKTSRPLARA